eukprot:6628565-Lingulodinium_polyedra.AAC.1
MATYYTYQWRNAGEGYQFACWYTYRAGSPTRRKTIAPDMAAVARTRGARNNAGTVGVCGTRY